MTIMCEQCDIFNAILIDKNNTIEDQKKVISQLINDLKNKDKLIQEIDDR